MFVACTSFDASVSGRYEKIIGQYAAKNDEIMAQWKLFRNMCKNMCQLIDLCRNCKIHVPVVLTAH